MGTLINKRSISSMNNKKIIQAIKEWLADNIVTDDEINDISDGTHDIVYGRKELAVSMLEKIHTWERFPENIITNKECK